LKNYHSTILHKWI